MSADVERTLLGQQLKEETPDDQPQYGDGEDYTAANDLGTSSTSAGETYQSENDVLDAPSWEHGAAKEAESHYDFEKQKARNEAIRRRQEVMGENQSSMHEYFGTEYQTNQKADKHGWTGGQLMDENTRAKFLQAQLNADVYARDAYVEGEFDSNLAVAREYASLKQKELAEEAYQKAQQNALARFELSGHYVSPEAADMLDQYRLAKRNRDDNPEKADKVMAEVEQYFADLGYGETIENEDGTTDTVADTSVLDAMERYTTSLHQKQLEYDSYLSEQAQALAQYEMRVKDPTASYEETDDGDLYIRHHGVENPDQPGMLWNGEEREWQLQEAFDAWEEEHADDDDDDDKKVSYEGGTERENPDTGEQEVYDDEEEEWVPREDALESRVDTRINESLPKLSASLYEIDEDHHMPEDADSRNEWIQEFLSDEVSTFQDEPEFIRSLREDDIESVEADNSEGTQYNITYKDSNNVTSTKKVSSKELLGLASIFDSMQERDDVKDAAFKSYYYHITNTRKLWGDGGMVMKGRRSDHTATTIAKSIMGDYHPASSDDDNPNGYPGRVG